MMQTKWKKLEEHLCQVLIGKEEVVRLVLATVVAGGHLLLNDRPGTGKTTLARALALGLGADFRRIQFTPDLMPADVVGGPIFDPKTADFRLVQGPIFSSVLLADEINRASPRAQSALLEGMEEGRVSLDGVEYPLPPGFFVIATQNPLGFAGTFPLPEAQLDRFLTCLEIGYPSKSNEIQILSQTLAGLEHPVRISLADRLESQNLAKQVEVHPDLVAYIVDLAQATREDSSLRLGLSTRGAMGVLSMAKAVAWLEGRQQLWPEDIHMVWPWTTAHRFSPKEGVAAMARACHILREIPVPR